jgi:hypothetical protein
MDGFVKNTCGAALDRAGDFAAVDAEPRLLGSDTHGDLGIVPGISTVIEGRSGPFGVIAVRGTDRSASVDGSTVQPLPRRLPS